MSEPAQPPKTPPKPVLDRARHAWFIPLGTHKRKQSPHSEAPNSFARRMR